MRARPLAGPSAFFARNASMPSSGASGQAAHGTIRPMVRAVVLALFVVSTPAWAQQSTTPGVPPNLDALLKSIRAADKGQLAVSEEDGRFLRVMVATRGAKSILEIGAA